MLKRFIYGGLFAVVCAGLVTVILLQRFDKITPIEVLQAVPEDAVLYMEDIDFEYLTESFIPGSRIWVDFVNTTGRSDLDSTLGTLLSQVKSSESFHDLLLKEGLNLSLHLVGKDQLIPLFYINYTDAHSDNDFEQIVLGMLGDEAMVNERKYETTMLFDVSGRPGFVPGKFSFTCMNGFCLMSSSSMLVEESVRTIHADSDLSMDKGLQLIRETAGKYVHANIYVNYEKLQQLFFPFVGQTSWDKLHLFSGLASWGELDLDVKLDAVILNGMTYANEEQSLLLGAFKGQSPVKMKCMK